jgi:ppGpp synthetase/RelA/SpoT-type nucleotidyltranferase
MSPSHGYRAVHIVASVNGRKVEIQLRTELQHLWAEISEKVSDIIDPRLKYGEGDTNALLFLNNLSTAITRVEKEEMARMDFMENLRFHNMMIDKRAKKKIRQHEKGFFQHRSQLLQLLKDVHEDFNGREAA